MNILIQSLTQACKLIQQSWCREAWARDENGNMVESLSPEAYSYSLAGCLYRGGFDVTQDKQLASRMQCKLFLRVNDETGFWCIGEFNDHSDSNQKVVIEFLQDWISELEEDRIGSIFDNVKKINIRKRFRRNRKQLG